MLLLAHRGDHRRAPENTLDAFADALALAGIHGLELDIRASKDGVAVVLHDATLTRVQGRPLRAARLTAAELAGHGVPTLAEVMAACPSDAFLDLELKEDLGRVALRPIHGARGRSDGTLAGAVISSFDAATLAAVRRFAPAWPCWLNSTWLSDRAIRAAAALGCTAIAAEWHRIDGGRMARARAAGLDVAAWTVRDAAVRDRLGALGVVAACVEGGALPEQGAAQAGPQSERRIAIALAGQAEVNSTDAATAAGASVRSVRVQPRRAK